MSRQETDLFTPIKIGDLTLKNRMVMAPLTRNRATPGDLAPNEMNVEYYRQRTSAGLIICEGSQIADDALGYPLTPGIHSPKQVAGWKKVTDAVHAEGGLIFMQLWHCGRVSHSSMLPGQMRPLAPSAIKPAGEVFTYEGMKPYETPQAIATEAIPGIIEQYRHAARCAIEAGFDGVEIHGANGYLLDQFLRDGSNQRDDQYGGSIENRARLLMEVTAAVCEIWDPQRVGVRLSPLQPFNDLYDSDPQATFSYTVKALNRFNLGYLHITEMGADNPGAAGPEFDISSLRPLWDGIYMTNFNYDKQTANQALAAGQADLIAFGRLFIANPDLPHRFAENAELNTPDPESFYGGDERGYIDYPFLDKSA